MNKPNLYFLGIGAQKAATSWIFKCLQEHPEISMPKNKEIHFFSNEENYLKGWDWYNTFFEKCDTNKKMGEFSVTYLCNPIAPARIKEHFPDIKLIVSLRNPVDRSFSHFQHLISKKSITTESLEVALKKYPAIIANSKYGKALSEYLKYFDKEQILILKQEDIKSNPLDFIKKIYNFLEVSDDFQPAYVSKKYHTSKARLSPLHKKINKIYLKMIKNPIGITTIKSLKKLGLNSLHVYHLLEKANKKEVKLKKEDEIFLQQYFKDDLSLLEQITNKKFY